MRKAVMLFIVGFFSFSLCAQKKGFHQGAYVTNHGDTMRGYIYLPETGESLKFKKVPASADISDVPVGDLKSLLVNNSSYLIWYGKRSVTWLDPIELDIKNVDSFRTELIMLRPVFEGSRYSLYIYQDETDRFFIGYAGVVEELQMTYRKLSDKEYRDRSLLFSRPNYSVYAWYRFQIIAILGGTVTDYERELIDHTDYNQQHLKKLIMEMEKW